MPSAYGEFGDDVGPRDGSYDDVGACEESYTSHSEPRFGVRYNPFVRKAYESYVRVHVRSVKIYTLYLIVLVITVDIV